MTEWFGHFVRILFSQNFAYGKFHEKNPPEYFQIYSIWELDVVSDAPVTKLMMALFIWKVVN